MPVLSPSARSTDDHPLSIDRALTMQDLLATNHFTVLEGVGGAGKTTIALIAANNATQATAQPSLGAVTLWLEAGSYTPTGDSMIWLERRLAVEFAIDRRTIDALLDDAQTVLVLDGLNEILDRDIRDDFVAAIVDVATRTKATILLINREPLGDLGAIGGGVQRVRIGVLPEQETAVTLGQNFSPSWEGIYTAWLRETDLMSSPLFVKILRELSAARFDLTHYSKDVLLDTFVSHRLRGFGISPGADAQRFRWTLEWLADSATRLNGTTLIPVEKITATWIPSPPGRRRAEHQRLLAGSGVVAAAFFLATALTTFAPFVVVEGWPRAIKAALVAGCVVGFLAPLSVVAGLSRSIVDPPESVHFRRDRFLRGEHREIPSDIGFGKVGGTAIRVIGVAVPGAVALAVSGWRLGLLLFVTIEAMGQWLWKRLGAALEVGYARSRSRDLETLLLEAFGREARLGVVFTSLGAAVFMISSAFIGVGAAALFGAVYGLVSWMVVAAVGGLTRGTGGLISLVQYRTLLRRLDRIPNLPRSLMDTLSVLEATGLLKPSGRTAYSMYHQEVHEFLARRYRLS
jgi:hypothetical protein